MQHNFKYISLFIVFTGLFPLISCDKDDAADVNQGYAQGVFIRCEGAFGNNNGSISFYDADSSDVVNNLFYKMNGRPAGDVIQSFALAGDKGIIVANNSEKIEIVNLETFESTATITGFSYPRYFQYAGNNTGYLSNGSFNGQVFKIDIRQGLVTDTIEVGKGPEQMVISGDHLYVANSGGWDYDNTVSVINLTNDEVVNNITVGDIPVALVADRNDNIWVLCSGKVVYDETWVNITEETDSKLVQINSRTGTIANEIIIGERGDYFNPSWLTISPDGETLFYGEAGGIYSMGINQSEQPSEPLLEEIFSNAGIHPQSGELFAIKITDYSTSGKLHIYNGVTLASVYDTGIAPGGIIFTDHN